MTDPRPDAVVLIQARAAAVGLDLSPGSADGPLADSPANTLADSLAGVIANTALLDQYAALLDRHTFADDCEPAFGYAP